MAKTKEELKELREEYESLSTKLKELTEDELSIVTGGTVSVDDSIINKWYKKESSTTDLETYFRPQEIRNNNTVYGLKSTYSPSKRSSASSYASISVSDFSSFFILSEKPFWLNF